MKSIITDPQIMNPQIMDPQIMDPQRYNWGWHHQYWCFQGAHDSQDSISGIPDSEKENVSRKEPSDEPDRQSQTQTPGAQSELPQRNQSQSSRSAALLEQETSLITALNSSIQNFKPLAYFQVTFNNLDSLTSYRRCLTQHKAYCWFSFLGCCIVMWSTLRSNYQTISSNQFAKNAWHRLKT